MAKTLYDVLEVSPSASDETIRAAYERLIAKFDPLAPENDGRGDVRFRHEAIKDAFLTLANPAKRQQYDRSLAARSSAEYAAVEAPEPFWTLPKIAVALLIVVALGGGYWKHVQTEKQRAAEREIAAARAREAEARARDEAARAEQARLEAAEERRRQTQESRARAEMDRARSNFEREQRMREASARMDQNRQRYEDVSRERSSRMQEQVAERERQRREMAAQDAARRQAAREREELCRIERERYGKAISC
ncbi:MAG: DnaJ domain-containing protein [Burkholderiales bacterium]|nr:DnaJ domain-containing protein [Burkholderiales bacterium]